MPSESVITLLGQPVKVYRLSLRGWSVLEGVKRAMDDAISKRDFNEYSACLVQFIEIASSTSNPEWVNASWLDVVMAYSEISKLNSPTIEFPMLVSGNGTKEKKLPWEYKDRSWFFWFNLFAKNYGWTENVIETMDIDTALGLYQEILIDDQFNKEWQWGLTEIAYPFNSSTKKSEFKPLERPDWMKPIIPKELPKVMIRRDMLPVGNIVAIFPPPEEKQEKKKRGI